MAHSIQTRGRAFERFDDFCLMALVLLLEAIASKNQSLYPNAKQVVSEWKKELRSAGPGTIELNLAAIGPSVETTSELFLLLNAIRDSMVTFGDSVPASALDRLCNVDGIRFGNIPTSEIKVAVNQLERLLQ